MQLLTGKTRRNAAKVELGTAHPPGSGYSMFDKVRESCLKD